MLIGGVCSPRPYKVCENAPESPSAGCMCLSRHGFVPSLRSFSTARAGKQVVKMQTLFDAALRSHKGAPACAGAATCSAQQRASPCCLTGPLLPGAQGPYP